MSSLTIPHAYRHLYKTALRSTRYSTPTRYIIRNALRHAFRSGNPTEFDAQKINNTLGFLERAGVPGTTERRVLKTWCMVRYWGQPGVVGGVAMFRGKDALDPALRMIPMRQYERVLRLMNESLGTCLK